MESKPSYGACFTFHVAVETNTELRLIKSQEKNGSSSSEVKIYGNPSIIPELPSEYSLLISRMQAVYK